MEQRRVLEYGHKQIESQKRQNAEGPHVEIVTTLEDLQEKYADLVERVTALPSRGEERIKETTFTPTGKFLDRYVTTYFETGDTEIPTLQLTLQTGHHIDKDDTYDHRQSTYIVVDWLGEVLTPNDARTNKIIQHEQLDSPSEYTDVPSAARTLGLIEESVAEAEKAFLSALA